MKSATGKSKGEDKVQYSLFFIQRFKGKVLFNVLMSDYTSLRIGGPADVMAFPQDEGDLKDLMAFADAKGFPFYVLGSGTNLLVRDGGIRGIVVNMTEGFKDITWLDGGKAIVGAGVKLPDLVVQARDRGLSGIEFAYGGEMKDVVEGIEIAGRKGQKGFIPKSELNFSYRRAEVPKGAIVTRAHMAFVLKDVEEIRAKITEFRERRKSTSSAINFPNAGSIFKNPDNAPAGRLIEEAGLKGERIGGAQVSEVHANYIVNVGGGRAKDVLALMALVRDRVYSSRGVVLEPELKVVGED
jgi:UDP-N-acetylmuramate dehydrogenase